MANDDDTETTPSALEKFGYADDSQEMPPWGATWDYRHTGWDDSLRQFDHLSATETTFQALLALYAEDAMESHGNPEMLVQLAYVHFARFTDQAMARIRELEAELEKRPTAV